MGATFFLANIVFVTEAECEVGETIWLPLFGLLSPLVLDVPLIPSGRLEWLTSSCLAFEFWRAFRPVCSETGLNRALALLFVCEDEMCIDEFVPAEKAELTSEALSEVPPVRVVAAKTLSIALTTNAECIDLHSRVKFIALIHAVNRSSPNIIELIRGHLANHGYFNLIF